MGQIDLKQLIEQYPEVLTDGTKLKAYILDLYPQCKRGMVNILVAIQQCGIVSEMQASKNPSALDMSRWKKVLDDDYGFAGATAENCLQMWCSAVGIQLEIKVSAEQKSNTARSKVQNDNRQSKQLSATSRRNDKSKIVRKDNTTVGVGDIYTFGTYPQDNDTKEPIKWLVLAKEDNKILLISEKALDCQKYNNSCADVTWETCSLRKWLNGTFLDTAFSPEERIRIVSTTASADKNPKYTTNPGNATTDNVFLLSINEAEQYFDNDEERNCVPTAYAIANGACASNKYTKGGAATCEWWLRSPGLERQAAACVASGGMVAYFGLPFDFDDCVCVRPALWIILNIEGKEPECKAREEKERKERELAEAKRREERKRLEQQRLALEKERREKGVCQHCGGDFKGLFIKKCVYCGRKKDY